MGLLTSSAGEDVEQLEHTYIAGGTTDWYYPCDNLWEYLLKLSMGIHMIQQFHYIP